MVVDSSVWIAYLRGDSLIEIELRADALEHERVRPARAADPAGSPSPSANVSDDHHI
jgi:hypothetical protein